MPIFAIIQPVPGAGRPQDPVGVVSDPNQNDHFQHLESVGYVYAAAA